MKKIKLSLICIIISNSLIGQITYTFTTAGATGRFGPSQGQLNTAYALTNLNGLVVSTSGIQTWTVPVSGPYRINARGATGGNLNSQQFGTGATMIGDVNLVAGDVLKIVVGQKGVDVPNVSTWEGGGGGGGSFVVKSVGNIPLVVAAGGAGGDGYGDYVARPKPGGSSGTGNPNVTGVANSPLASSAGGGFTFNGANGANCTGGISFANGANGGTCNYGAAQGHGGFGGGGAGDYYTMGGAGGGYQGGNTKGGYSGSDGLTSAYSYNSGTNQTNTSGITTNNIALKSNGIVFITSLYSINISQTSSILCNGLSTAALSSTVNGGVPPFTYTWSPSGGNTYTASGLGAGVYTLTARGANTSTISATFTVTQPSALATSVSSQTNVSCFGGTNGAGVILVSGGVPAYTYTWYPSGGNASSASALAAGVFSINIKDANNCTTSTSLTITQPASLAVTASVNNAAVCAGASVIFTGAGANSYAWSGGASNGIAYTPAASGIYTVTGTVGVCSQTATVGVTVNPNPIITVNSGVICAGQNFTINPNGANTYTIQGGNAVVSPPSNTSYTVAGTSTAGCVSQAFATSNLTVNPNPTITVNNGTICVGQNFTINPNGANTYTIQGGNAVVSPSSNSSYTVIGTNSATGCRSQAFATSSLIVNANPIITVNSGAICAGQNFTINPNGANTYTIQGGNAVVSPAGNTSYTVAGTSTAGCVSQAFATSNLTVNSNPTVSISGPSVVCLGDSISLVANGANTYVWNNNATTTTIVITPTTTSTYSAVGTDTNGCVGLSAVDSIFVNPVPILSIISTATAICAGDTVKFTAAGATSYAWNIGDNDSLIVVTPTITTTYSVVGTNGFGCTSTKTDSVKVNALPNITISGTTGTICIGENITLTANGANTYTWSGGINTNSIAVSPSVSTTYSASGTSTDGCVGSNTLQLNVTECTNIKTIASKAAIKVYPNPNNGEFTIELTNINNSNITITNVLGQIIKTQKAELMNQINLNLFEKGVYFINVVENNQSVYRGSIIKQ